MKLLLDSHAFIWAFSRPTELSRTARQAIEDPSNDRFVSISSIWEITLKAANGKLAMPDNFTDAIQDLGAAPLQITIPHIKRLQTLPLHHRDPFDRLLIAQAIEENLTIATRNRHFPAYGVPLLMA